jgi:hypothetical protein
MQNQSLLPPIFQPSKKIKKKQSGGISGLIMGASQNGVNAP